MFQNILARKVPSLVHTGLAPRRPVGLPRKPLPISPTSRVRSNVEARWRRPKRDRREYTSLRECVALGKRTRRRHKCDVTAPRFPPEQYLPIVAVRCPFFRHSSRRRWWRKPENATGQCSFCRNCQFFPRVPLRRGVILLVLSPHAAEYSNARIELLVAFRVFPVPVFKSTKQISQLNDARR